MKPLRVGMLGLGTVGGRVARLLEEEGGRIAERSGRKIELARVLVRDPDRKRDVVLGRDRITTQGQEVVDDPEIDVVVELIGGVEPALSYVQAALAAGKSVVTANKAMLAERGREIFDAARRGGGAVAFEASVAGGVPIVQAVSSGLAANSIARIAAILNGTCNYILSAMSQQGLTYGAALAQAQALGYAERDPTLDVDGTDTAHKLAILAQLAFGATVTTADIPRQGIDRLDAAEIRFAAELGYAIKLLALARRTDDGAIELRVAPRLVRLGTPLADVRDAYNAVRVLADPLGDTLFYGRGAGAGPTASAVVADLIDLATGRAQASYVIRDLWRGDRPGPRLARPEEVRSRFYLRFSVADRPGVIGRIAQTLGQQQISIASVIQHERDAESGPDGPVPLILMTYAAPESAMAAALAEIDRFDIVQAPSVCYGVE